MTVTLPETLQYGKVVGRFVLAVADVSEDPDVLPNAVPAVGTINFTSMNPLTKETTATPPTTVVRSVISAAIDNNGYLYNPKDPTGPRGIWLVAGPYKVSYALNTGAIAGHDILVLPEHDDLSPLDLISALPPGGPTLTASQYAELTARVDILEAGGGSGGGVTDHSALTGLDDDDHPHYALADGTRGSFAASLGADDNYVTDAEKTKLANLSGTNTGDQVLPTWSTISGKPAVIAEGATQADARTAIGAGTSNLAIGTTGTTAAAGNRAASTTAIGMVELATNTEATTGADTTRAVTPAGVKAVVDALTIPYSPDDIGAAPATQPVSVKTAAYTLTAPDAGSLIEMNLSAGAALNVPGSVFTTGQRIDVLDVGTGRVTFVGTSGMTLNGVPSLVSSAQWSGFSIFIRSATTAAVVGRLA